MYRTDISRSIIDREKWKIKNRKISEEQNVKKQGCGQARGRTCVNIGADFQRWRELKESEGFESDAEAVLFYTTHLCCLLFEYACVSSSLFPRLCIYKWAGDFKIGARSCWGMGVFVLVLSNINIVWQKSLRPPLQTSCGLIVL